MASCAFFRSSRHVSLPRYQNSVTYRLMPSSLSVFMALSKSTWPSPYIISRNFPGIVSFKCSAARFPLPLLKSSSTSVPAATAALVIFPISGYTCRYWDAILRTYYMALPVVFIKSVSIVSNASIMPWRAASFTAFSRFFKNRAAVSSEPSS